MNREIVSSANQDDIGSDPAIQQLSRDVPADPVTVQLTSFYHNLLRRWAEM